MVFRSGLVLLLAMFGQNFSPNANSGTAIGIFWAICGIALLAIAILFDFRYVRIAQGIAAYLIGTAILFWSIGRIHNYRQQYHYERLPD